MDKTTTQLLMLLSSAMGTREMNKQDIQDADWNKLFYLAKLHNITPMIYEAAQYTQSFSKAPHGLSDLWRHLTISNSINQLNRTMEFLMVYEKLSRSGIQTLVVKGITCRKLYPNHYYRCSNDEDVYMKREDFKQADAILQASGLIRDKRKLGESCMEQVTTYRSPRYGLSIELHVDLFPTDTKLYEPMNRLFHDAFEESTSIMTDGFTVHTLSHTSHLLFLILHSIKHFLATGFGIRQVCDMVMFINTYGLEINWALLWSQLIELRYEVFVMNLLDIGKRYLGLNPDRINYSIRNSTSDNSSDALLSDIMDAGIFGKCGEQVKTSSITLNALAKDKRQKGVPKADLVFLKMLFPGIGYMSSHYIYCRKNPLLLPVAWIHRIILNIAEEKSLVKMLHKTDSTLAIGRKRTQLLKEYKIIGR